jgi:hypothetical protein
MTDNNGHVDGDDYTWENTNASQAGAVLNPAGPGVVAAFAELRERFGAAFDAIEDVDAWVKGQRSGEPEPGTTDAWAERWQRLGQRTVGQALDALEAPDLRTADQVERDDVAALRADLERLAELVRLTTGPVDVALQVDEHGDQIVELGLRCDNLVDALQALTVRVATVERTVAGLVKVLEVRL